MGSNFATELASGDLFPTLDLESAIAMHLQDNHYPPVPVSMVQPCIDAIDAYWECWLYYEYATDKTRSNYERISKCRDKFPQTWTWHKEGKEETVDYYQRILKSKYL